MMQGEKKSKFGELLVEAGIVSQAQLDHALQVQKEQEERQSIGGVLVDLGYLTRRRLRGAAKRYGRRVLVGELLLAEGAITREQLDKALREQKVSGQSLGRLLIEKGVLDEDQLARALGKQLDMPYIVPHSGMVDMSVFCRLPEQFIRSNSVIPLSESDGTVTVLVADPVDSDLTAKLEKALGSRLQVATCSKTRLDKVIEELMFRRELGIGRVGVREATREAPSSASLSIDSRTISGSRGDMRTESAFDGIISDALNKGATDIHFEPQRDHLRIRYRMDGMLGDASTLPLSLVGPFVRRAKVLSGLNPTESHRRQEGRLSAEVDGEEYDLRVAVLPSIFGETMVIHCFSRKGGMMDPEDLGMLPQVLADYLATARHSLGATLFVGPTGSGKTTTFYSALNELNDGSRKIITIEAPVELALDGIVQGSLRRHTAADLIEGLMNAMQHDPDVIALGRITSDEVAERLLYVAMMGHKVFSTLHAEDSASALVRLCNLPGSASFITSCSITLVSQMLVRRICAGCSEVYVPSPKIVSEFQVRDVDLDAVDFRRGVGCSECMGTGFRGRTGIFELFEVGPEMQRGLLGKPSANEIRREVMKTPHFLSLRQAGFLKVVQGLTTLEEVVRAVPPLREETAGSEQYSLDDLCRRADLKLKDRGTGSRR